MSVLPRARVEVIYNGTDITKDIAGDVIAFSYTDNESGKADDLSITLKDDDGLWAGAWFPARGDTIEATIITETDEGEKRLPCGSFSIDELTGSGGDGETFEIAAVSVPVDASIRREIKSKAWEDVTLSSIAGDIASAGGLELLFVPLSDPLYDRRDQRDETDLQFLLRLCDDEALSLKITDRQLVIFNSEEQEQEQPVATIYKREGDVIGWQFKGQAHDIYGQAVVEYKDPQTGLVNQYVYTDPKLTNGKSFRVVQRAASIAEAERIAKAALRKKNRYENTGSITLVGKVEYIAGVTIELLGFGKFSGKYLIEKSSHEVGGGHQVGLDLTKVRE